MPRSSAKQRRNREVPFEAVLWRMANALRGSMDAAEYKHVVLGLKYISDVFEEHRKRLSQEAYADPEDPDEYRGDHVFWVPPEACWERLQQSARQPNIGQLIDKAMEAIERENPSLKGVLPKDYAKPALDKGRLGQLVDLIGNLRPGGADARDKDVLGREQLLELLRTDAAFREEVRRIILTDDLLALPPKVDQLIAVVRELSEQVRALVDTQRQQGGANSRFSGNSTPIQRANSFPDRSNAGTPGTGECSRARSAADGGSPSVVD